MTPAPKRARRPRKEQESNVQGGLREDRRKLPKLRFRHNDTEHILLERPGENLYGVDLSGAQLAGAAMYAIEVLDADAQAGKILNVDNFKAHLSNTDLSNADLRDAVFSDEVIVRTNFTHAVLRGATFVRTHFVQCDFTNANLTNARFGETTFSDCPTLGSAIGLDAVEHLGPSGFTARTLRGAVLTLPDGFLIGAGYTQDEIVSLRHLYTGREFYSCFISYAREDHEFAQRLRGRLVRSNISCWLDTSDLKPGEYWRTQIDNAIDRHDKLILVCSRRSLNRPAVVNEVFAAIDREKSTGAQKLFPIRVDDYVLSAELDALAERNVHSGQWRENWPAYVRAYHIPDFSRWREPRWFGAEFRKLLSALRHPAAR